MMAGGQRRVERRREERNARGEEGIHRVREAAVAVQDRRRRSVILKPVSSISVFQQVREPKETHPAGRVMNMGTLVPSLLS